MGYVELIKMFKDMSNPGDVENYLDIIEKNAMRLGRLSTDLTEMQMIEIGLLDITKKPVNIDGCIDEVQGEIKPILDNKSQTLKYVRHLEQTQVPCDKLRLSQVIINLLSNTSKFSDDDSPICLDVRDTKDGVVFTVRDEGVGLAPDDIGEAVHTFPGYCEGFCYRVHGARVELHDGRIWAESDWVGKGTMFFFTVPSSG